MAGEKPSAATSRVPSSADRQRPRDRQLTGTQVIFATILAVGLILAINFSSRIIQGQPMQEALDKAKAEIESLKEENTRLLTERDFARSDAFVEQWARDAGKMIREGDVLVIPVPASVAIESTPVPAVMVAVETTPPQPEPYSLWWGLFFDGEPPEF